MGLSQLIKRLLIFLCLLAVPAGAQTLLGVSSNVYVSNGNGISVAPLQQVATRGAIPGGLTAAAGPESICRETRLKYTLGKANQSEIRVLFVGYFIASNTDIETPIGNSISLQSAWENGTATQTVQFTFSQSTSPIILSNGQVALLSDPIFPASFSVSSYAGNSSWFYRGRSQVTSGQFFLSNPTANSSGEADKLSDCTSGSQLLATGPMTTPTSGSSASAVFYPALVLGRAIGSADIAILGVGDSIMVGFNDNGSGTNPNVIGWFPRGLDAGVNGRIPPWARFAAIGTSAHTFIAQAVNRLALFQYFTHFVSDYGRNDNIVLGRTASQTIVDLQTIWGLAQSNGPMIRSIGQMQILPDTTDATDGWTTVPGQTPVSGFQTGGSFRGPLNSAILGDVGLFGLNYIFNAGNAIADAISVDRFAAPGTVITAIVTGTIATNVMTVTGITTGVLAINQTITGTSVTPTTYITSLGTGSGGLGTYNLSQSSTVSVAEALTASVGVAQTLDGIHPNAAGNQNLIGPAWTTQAGTLN